MKCPALLLSLALALLARAKSEDSTPARAKAPSVTMGKVNAWSETDASGVPQPVGFTLGKGALDNLPNNAATNGTTPFMLSVPDEVSQKTPFQHITVGRNALGHEPTGIYDTPHFDFHFYMQPMTETRALPPYAQAKAKFNSNPPADQIPAGFAKNPGGVPGMGRTGATPAAPSSKGRNLRIRSSLVRTTARCALERNDDPGLHQNQPQHRLGHSPAREVRKNRPLLPHPLRHQIAGRRQLRSELPAVCQALIRSTFFSDLPALPSGGLFLEAVGAAHRCSSFSGRQRVLLSVRPDLVR